MVTITTTKTTTEVKPFPKLMACKITGSIVFFTEHEKGLWASTGIWYESLNMENYEDYNEEVTLKNK